MAFDLHIKNIGKLSDAKIRIGQFTVLAGPNNTGKSTVSKLLYSLFDAMNVNPADVYIKNLTDPSLKSLDHIEGYSGKVDILLSPLREEVENLQNLVIASPADAPEELDQVVSGLADKAGDILLKWKSISPKLENICFTDADSLLAPWDKDDLDRVEQSLVALQENLNGKNYNGFIISGLEHKINGNLIQNFQVPKLSDIRGEKDEESEVVIDGIGKFDFSNGVSGFSIQSDGLRKLQRYSKVIYLESPVYWKLKNVLEFMRVSPRFLYTRRRQLSGVPRYFYDLAGALKHEYTGDIDFPELYEKLTSDKVLGGKIAISDSGDLSFQENGRSFSLPITAMGVANLGMLALLIERKVLDKDSFLFIDEPEAHLHPAWQVIMAETLFELAKGGVNVVVATHSADILKWLEVHVKKNPDDEDLIALNKFPVNGDGNDEQDFDDKMADIKQELTKPFADLYMKGLL